MGDVLTDNNGLHTLEFNEIFEQDLNEIRRKVNEIGKITFDAYR